MNPRSICPTLRTAAVLCSTLLAAHAARPQSAVITLDPASSRQAIPAPVRGEASYANLPANYHAFAAAHVGEPAPVESLKLLFAAATKITAIRSTEDFTVEPGGSCIVGDAYAKGDTCVLLVRFTPQGPGARMGRITITHSASPEPATLGLGGNGYAPVVSFTPAIITTVPATYPSGTGLLTGAHNLTDAGDILYIADTGNGLIRQIDSSGTVTNTTPVAPPESVVVDRLGYIYTVSPGSTDYFSWYPPYGGYTFYFNSWTIGTCTASAPCSLGSVGMGSPQSLSIDPQNNIFLLEATEGAMAVSLDAPAGELANVWYLNDGFAPFNATPTGFAVNAYDDLFTAFTYPAGNTCYIVEEPLYGADGTPVYTRVAGASKCGYSGDGGQGTAAEIGSQVTQITFDIAGNLYFSDTANQRVRRIDNATGIVNSIAGNGIAGYIGDGNQATNAELSSPTGVAVDSQGIVYIISGTAATGAAQVVRKLGPNGYLGFSTETVASTSLAHMLTVSNTGNDPLTLTSAVFKGTNAGDFSIDPKTTTCVLTVGSTLQAGAHCLIGVLFKPAAAGYRTANLVLLDNTVNSSNTVQLSGTGVTAGVKLSPSSVAFAPTAPERTSVKTITITNSGEASLNIGSIIKGGSNPNMFSYTSSCGSSVAPHGACNLQVTFEPSAKGAYAAEFKIADNAPDSPQTLSVAGTSTAPAASATTLSSVANPSAACSPAAFEVQVTSSADGVPIGMVQLKNGDVLLASAKLSNGKAAFSTTQLPAGANVLTAAYQGDEIHNASTSPVLRQIVQSGTSCSEARPARP